nr:DUF6786 family protein [uncultured Allomuricauda sp.]
METKGIIKLAVFFILTTIVLACKQKKENEADGKNKGIVNVEYISYGDEVKFMESFIDVVELNSASGEEKVAVAPQLQGRVMTSSSFGDSGRSYGWVNRELFKSGDTLPHINIYGGEERFWLGPEGGQYSIFFKKGDDFNLDNWYTPRFIDLDPFEIKERKTSSVSFVKNATLTNYADYTFELGIERKVELCPSDKISQELDLDIPPSVKSVAYLTTNSLTNLGTRDWQKETGLLSIWLLGMYNASPAITVVIPFHPGEDEILGKPVTDDYFGKVPAERLIVKDSVLYFSGDAKFRSKIGLSPSRAKNIMGSYDGSNQVLTIIKFSKPDGVSDYVNSLWEIQDQPYKGDVVNSYNDGPPSPGEKQLGQFYELETSSPALALKAGENASHCQLTCHFEGDEIALDSLSKQLLGVSILEITTVFELPVDNQ